MKLQEFVKAVEMQRFHMGMGVLEFCKYLGMNYATYNSFRRNRKKTAAKTMQILLEFAISRGIKVSELELE